MELIVNYFFIIAAGLVILLHLGKIIRLFTALGFMASPVFGPPKTKSMLLVYYVFFIYFMVETIVRFWERL